MGIEDNPLYPNNLCFLFLTADFSSSQLNGRGGGVSFFGRGIREIVSGIGWGVGGC